MAINAAQVVAQFGAYYKPTGDEERNLRNMLYYGSQINAYFEERPGDDTIYRGSSASMTRVVQPFQKAFTPIGTVTFKPNEFSLDQLKIDLEESPDDLEATYLGFMAKTPTQDRSQWPFVRWYLEKHVLPRKNEDLDLNEYFKGNKTAPTSGTAGAVSTAMNGIRKVIRGYNTAGRTNLGNGPIVTGALSTDPVTFCTQVESFVDALHPLYRSNLDHIFMSDTLVKRYRRGKRAKYNTQYLQTTELSTVMDYENISVVGFFGQEGSDMIWTSLPTNRIRPTKKAVLGNSFKVETSKRLVSIYTDWWESLNFEVPELVFHNDRDLV